MDYLFYGLIVWTTYLLVTMIPRYKNPAIKIFFNFLDIIFVLYLAGMFGYGNYLWFGDDAANSNNGSVCSFFTELFLIVTYIIFGVLALAMVTFIFRKLSSGGNDDNDEEN